MPLARKLGCFLRLNSSEASYLGELQHHPLSLKQGTEFVHEGEGDQRAFILISGWGCCYKLLPEGSRQIISFPLPGDIVGLSSLLLPTADQSCTALTDVAASCVDAKHMMRLFTEFPRLAAAILGTTVQDQAILVDHLVDIGRRRATQRVAHFFLELSQRLQWVGLGSETEYECPLTQQDLADALGLSQIHVNRVLRHLREQGILTLQLHMVNIHSLAGLKPLAGYDDACIRFGFGPEIDSQRVPRPEARLTRPLH